MTTAEDYRRSAGDCLTLAKAATDESQRTMLIEMAAKWFSMAETAERAANDAERDKTG